MNIFKEILKDEFSEHDLCVISDSIQVRDVLGTENGITVYDREGVDHTILLKINTLTFRVVFRSCDVMEIGERLELFRTTVREVIKYGDEYVRSVE